MIDVMQTRLGDTLRKTRLLYDSVAWLEAITPELRVKAVREWIQNDQLKDKGVDSKGQIIGFYSLATEFFSEGRKRAGDPYDLEDTGEFYRSMFVRVLIDAVVFEADSVKMEDQIWWHDDILNLTDDNLQKFIQEVRENYISYARRTLGIN